MTQEILLLNIANFVQFVLFRKQNDNNKCYFSTYFSFIAKTETASPEMDYIINRKLSGVGEVKHRNNKTAMYTQTEQVSVNEKTLPLFSTLPDPANTIKRLMELYELDMKLFGYDYEIQDGRVIASCTIKTDLCC